MLTSVGSFIQLQYNLGFSILGLFEVCFVRAALNTLDLRIDEICDLHFSDIESLQKC
jgi:hypothetical protein